MKTIFSLTVCCGLMVVIPTPRIVSAASDETPATAPESLDPRIWELTDYLQGTAGEIRDKMNGEVERLAVKVRDTEGAIKQGNIDCANDEKDALEKMHKTEPYIRWQAELV